MIRTLVGYDHVAGPAGNKLVPDIATTVPKPTDGGKTYTFHLKPGVKFGPPVNREVTSSDVLYAIERIAHPKDGAEYAFYYSVISGFDAYARGQGEDDLGDPDPEPEHDRLPPHAADRRLPLPAGDARDGADPGRGRRGASRGRPASTARTSSRPGPYMIQGADKVDDSLVRDAQADERLGRASRT